MSKVSRTYRLSQDTVDKLDKLANDSGVTATEALTRAIHSAADEKYDVNTPLSAEREVELANARADELAHELERIHAALEKAQDSLRASQVMQQIASDRAEKAESELRALPGPDAWKSKPLLDRVLRR